MSNTTTWRTYEQVARHLLNQFSGHFGVSRVEGKQLVASARREGEEWEVDAKGVLDGTDIFMLVECRRRKDRLKKSELAALAYQISDTGAAGGIVVSPAGLQRGAKAIARAENVVSVILSSNSTPSDFVISFFDRLTIGMTDVYPTDQIGERLLIVATDARSGEVLSRSDSGTAPAEDTNE